MPTRIEELGAPASEFNEAFAEGMRKRMAVSYHKYGLMSEASAKGIDQIASLKVRLQRYEDTGNTEWLMDVANMAMIEFSYPQHPDAHFRATDSDESPGRVVPGNFATSKPRLSAAHNREV